MKFFRNYLRFILAVLLTVSIFSGLVLGETAANDGQINIPEIKYSFFKLDNGLEIFVFEDHQVPLVEVSLWYKVGSLDEPEGLTGISHLLEHTMFLGTETLEKDQIHQLVEKVGGFNNAVTSFTYTKYYEELPASNLELGIAIEADRMRNLKFDPEEFEREKEVVMQERRRSIENDAIRSAYEELMTVAFQRSPLRHQIIGWMEDIKGITVEQINSFYRQYYAPNNAVLVVSGAAEPQVVKQLAERYFGGYQPQKIERIAVTEPEQNEERSIVIKKLINIPYIIMIYKLPAGNHPEMTAVEFALEILVNKASSRINTELKQKQEIILGADAWVHRLPIPGYAQIVLAPVGTDQIEEVIRGFDRELKRLIDTGVSAEEIGAVKKAVLKELAFAQRDPGNFKNRIIYGHLHYNNAGQYQEEIRAINELTPEDIVRAAEKYFVKGKRTIGYIVPQGRKSINNRQDIEP